MSIQRSAVFAIAVLLLVVVGGSSVFAIDSRTSYRQQDDVLYYGEGGCVPGGGGAGGGSNVQLAGNDNVEKMLNYLQSKGLTLEQAAGVVGNLQWESGSKELDPEGSDGVAVGIAQWQSGRLDNLKKHAGDSYNTFDSQVEYLGVELGWEPPKNGANGGSEAAVLDKLKTATTPEEAALIWDNVFERSGDGPGSKGEAMRQQYAREVYEKYKNGASQSSGNGQEMAANTGQTCGGATGAPGKVNADGYAWPIALNQQEVDGNWPCTGSCHHDGTPAFDLARKAEDDSTEGVGIIAIYNGTIQRFNNSYGGTSGCQAFQLVGDDGYWYWYGHLQAASVQDGTKVSAGQQIATVGRRACTGNGSYPHLHIDRGSPKGHYGGSECCRDPEFVPLMNKLHDELGGGNSDSVL